MGGRSIFTAAIASTTLVACAPGDNGIEVTGYLDETSIEITASEQVLDNADVEITIVGRPGAASNDGQVVAANTRTDGTQTVDISPTGSFVVRLDARLNDTLRLRHSHNSDQAVDVVLDTPFDAFPAVDQTHVTAPDFEGYVGVEIRFSAPIGDAVVIISNFDNHHAATLRPYEQDPLWHVGHIPAQTGHHLVAGAENSAGVHTLGLELVVP